MEKVIAQIKELAQKDGYDVIEQISPYKGNPTFLFSHSWYKKGMKLGLPYIITIVKNKIKELNPHQTLEYLKSFDGFRKSI